jgi:hypothetical protein
VEAKRKRGWRSRFDPESDEFLAELRAWLRGRLHEASKKQLVHPVYWFELSIGQTMDEGQAKILHRRIADFVRAGEDMTVNGNPPQPAYVIVTNNADFANDDATGLVNFAMLMGFRMDDFREEAVEMEVALERHDRHRPIRRVLQCLGEVQQIPTSFDGIPDELLDENGDPIETLRIGAKIAYPDEKGEAQVGTIAEISAMDEKAWLAVTDESKKQSRLITAPLTKQEADAAKKLGNAIFGKPEGPHSLVSDPMHFYDRMLEIHAKYPRASLLRQLESHPRFSEFSVLSDDELRIRAAREMTKSVVATNARPKTSS